MTINGLAVNSADMQAVIHAKTSLNKEVLTDRVNTFGHYIQAKYGEKVHKVAINADFTCPNRDGTKGWGGCTFCNNRSFSPNHKLPGSIRSQVESGRSVIRRRTGARLLVAYFQAYTNTYSDIERLRNLYDEALAQLDVIGLAIGTRPDCVPEAVLDLLSEYRQQGYEVWLELGLQSSFDDSLARVNRGHDFNDYRVAVRNARALHLPVCTHLIIGLPGETESHARTSLIRVIELGVEGIKLHPLHVVKNTLLAKQWRQSTYHPLTLEEYVRIVCDLIELTPPHVVFHRLTGTAPKEVLLAPEWCGRKWTVINAIHSELLKRCTYQGTHMHSSVEACQ